MSMKINFKNELNLCHNMLDNQYDMVKLGKLSAEKISTFLNQHGTKIPQYCVDLLADFSILLYKCSYTSLIEYYLEVFRMGRFLSPYKIKFTIN